MIQKIYLHAKEQTTRRKKSQNHKIVSIAAIESVFLESQITRITQKGHPVVIFNRKLRVLRVFFLEKSTKRPSLFFCVIRVICDSKKTSTGSPNVICDSKKRNFGSHSNSVTPDIIVGLDDNTIRCCYSSCRFAYVFNTILQFNYIEQYYIFEQKHLGVSGLFIKFAVFNKIEHAMMIEQMSNQEILNRAVAALNSNLYREKATVDYDRDIPCLNLMGKRFRCVVKPNLTLGEMTEKCIPIDKEERILYVTINATPKMLELAKLPDVNVLDCAGNFNIQYQLKNGNVVLMLANKGEKPIEENIPKAYPIFLEKGLKVIFYLLLDKKNIGRPYRNIMDATGVAIGTVKNIIDGLVYQQFARIEGNKRFLTNADRLLMLWATNYGQILKPKLLHTRFAFRNEEKRKNWKEMTLPDGMIWGGEPAAALTDAFLTPGEFTVYTDVPAATLMKTGAVIPDTDGDITVYDKFWAGEDAANVTPAILTYADLMDTANGRCIEAAQKIKENELKYLL